MGSERSQVAVHTVPHPGIRFVTFCRVTDGWQCNIRNADNSWTIDHAFTFDEALLKATEHYSVSRAGNPHLETLEWVEQQYKQHIGSVPLRPELPNRKSILNHASTLMTDLNQYLTQKREEREKTDPMPSSPIHPPILNVFVKNIEDERSSNFGFSALHGARRLIDFAISDRPHKWIDDNTILVGDKLQIWTDSKPDGLSQILEHEFTPKERSWDLPGLYMRRVASLFVAREPDWTDRYTAPAPSSAPDAPKPQRERAERKPKVERPTGLTDLPTLLADTDITPKEARNALRKLGTPKPPHGRWEFTADEAKTLKPSIVKKVKELRK